MASIEEIRQITGATIEAGREGLETLTHAANARAKLAHFLSGLVPTLHEMAEIFENLTDEIEAIDASEPFDKVITATEGLDSENELVSRAMQNFIWGQDNAIADREYVVGPESDALRVRIADLASKAEEMAQRLGRADHATAHMHLGVEKIEAYRQNLGS